MQENNEEKVSLITSQFVESAYLPSSEAAKYEALKPGFIEHLTENVVKEREHRHSLDTKSHSANIIISYIEAGRRILNSLVAFTTILVFAYIVYYGYQLGQSTNATALAGLVGAIVTALKWLNKSSDSKK